MCEDGKAAGKEWAVFSYEGAEDPETRHLLSPELRATHVIPLNDLQPHACSPFCWCKPLRDGDDLFIHNSADGREKARH